MRQLLIAIKLAYNNLRLNKARTFLSLLGVMIGVAIVIVILSLGDGVRKFIVDQVESFGTDTIGIEIKVPNTAHMSSENVSSISGGMQITTLKVEDAEEVAKRVSNIDSWYFANIGQDVVDYGGRNKQAMLMGVTADILKVDAGFELEEGEMFTDDDNESLSQSVVLGSALKEYLFGSSNAVGMNIKVSGKRYKVAGVLKERGQAGFFNFDEIAYLPLRTLQKKIMGVDYAIYGSFKVKDPSKIEVTKLEIEEVMRDQHDIDDPDDDDFAVASIAEATEMLDDIFKLINYLLLGLTSISLLVGGVGIMNVMYVAVTERTFEIGLRKAVGAKNQDILKQFLLEAVFLTIFGGILGILFGFLLSMVAEYVMVKLDYALEFPISINSIILGVGFSVAVGLIFGIYPAKKASRLSPMEALRKE